MPLNLAFDLGHGTKMICGIDEVGRGPLAGPVFAAAVILPEGLSRRKLRGLDDSKRLNRARREALSAEVLACARVGFGRAEVEEIDSINILQATFLAMARAMAALGEPAPLLALVDGNRPPKLPCAVRCVIGGDGISRSIAAASVVAKVARDAEMAKLAADWPHFGWERNAGYGTGEHLTALTRHGPTPHHRRSFAPVAALL